MPLVMAGPSFAKPTIACDHCGEPVGAQDLAVWPESIDDAPAVSFVHGECATVFERLASQRSSSTVMAWLEQLVDEIGREHGA